MRALGLVALTCSYLSLVACGGDDSEAVNQGANLDKDAGADAASSDSQSGPPPEVTAHVADWPLPNRDYQSTRAIFDSDISSATVAKLQPAWMFELPSGGLFGAATAPPIVLGGTVYYVDMQSNVFAINTADGKEVWKKLYNRATAGPNGVAVGWGKLFVPAGDHVFAALDLKDGHELWTAKIDVPETGGIDLAPVAYDGLVYLSTVPLNSTSSYLGGASGILYALHQADGTLAWQFDTVDSKDRWGNPDVNSGGGAWYPPSIDVQTGLMYWGTGNAAPYPGNDAFPNGVSRPGDNLYTSCVLALDHAQEKLAWYYQDAKHNLFDMDFQNSPIIVETQIAGAARKLVIGSGKTGAVAALDALTGELLWRTPVGVHLNDDITAVPDGGIEVYPGDLGGVETPPAYAEGVVFVPVVNWSRTYLPNAPGDRGATNTGELVALDVTDGSQRWKATLEAPVFGAATVVNDLVFVATIDGVVSAFDRASGVLVWSYTAPLGINAPLSVTKDTLYVPAGTGLGVPSLIALRIK